MSKHVEDMNKEELAERLSRMHVPGHGPDYWKLSKEELVERLNHMNKMFEIVFGEDEHDEQI